MTLLIICAFIVAVYIGAIIFVKVQEKKIVINPADIKADIKAEINKVEQAIVPPPAATPVPPPTNPPPAT